MNIFKVLSAIILFNIFSFGVDFSNPAFTTQNVNKMAILNKQLASRYPDIAHKLENIQQELALRKSEDAVYFFVSSSVPISSIEDFIKKASVLNYYYGTKSLIVFQGITDKKYEEKMQELLETLGGYEFSSLFYNNFVRIIDPKIFKTLQITKAPALGFALHSGNSYPSKANMKYLIRGDVSLDDFFLLISKKEKRYEAYSNSLLSSN